MGVAVYGATTSPEILGGYDALSWLLILVPAFLLAYYRGWRAATRLLAGGTLLVLLAEAVAALVFGLAVNWLLLYWVAIILVAVGLGTALISELLQREHRDALVLAYSDPLTGLPNRRLVDFVLDKEFAAAIRGRPLSLVSVDVDGFAAYNGRHGRAAGDRALQLVAQQIDRHMRRMNLGGRYRDDQFLCVLSGERVDGAWVFADRLRAAIAEMLLPTGEHLTVSVGIAPYERRMRDAGELIEAAGEAVRRGSEQGGDRVVCETGGGELAGIPEDVASLPLEQQKAVEAALRQQALEEAEKRHRSLFDGVPVGLYRATPDGEILDANPALVRMFGFPNLPSLLAVNASRLYADPRERLKWVERLKTETLVRDFEIRLRRLDGTLFWGRDTSRAVLGRGGAIQYYEGMLEDITERKRAEEELRSANEMLQAVFDAAPVAVFAIDVEGRVINWNAAAESMFGWTADEVIGKGMPAVREENREEFARLRRRVLSGELVMGEEVRRHRRDGSPVWLHLFAAPLYDDDGRAYAIMSVMVDVTERRELEARLAQSQKMESIGQLAGGVAHDFNNVLTAVIANCENLLGELGPEQPGRREVLEIRKAADHAAALTRQLLAFGRRQLLRPRVLSLNAVIEDTRQMLDRVIGENVALKTRLAADLWNTRADPVEIGQVMINLAVNARDAMQEGGELTVSTRNVELDAKLPAEDDSIPPGSYVVLQVSDTGSGIGEEIKGRIFEPFFTTKEKGKGTGLGLSTVYGIVRQTGGFVTVDSEVGDGTTFSIYLPEAPGETDPVRVERRPTTRPKASESILLVEDERALRDPMRRGLELQGYRILEATNADEALVICRDREKAIDMMVTDVVMPGMDGLELGKEAKKLRPDLKILYMSGYSDDVISRRGTLKEGMAFLQKPFTPSDLAARIRDLLG